MTQQNQDTRYGFGPQVTERKPGRDGHSPRANMDTFSSILQGQMQGHLAKDLIHPGKEAKEMLMRTSLIDVNEARDVALVLAKCDEFDMEEEKQLILYLLAARTSVKGQGRLEYLQGIVNILSPAMLGFKGAKIYDHNRPHDENQK